jgi:hypothetical protein
MLVTIHRLAPECRNFLMKQGISPRFIMFCESRGKTAITEYYEERVKIALINDIDCMQTRDKPVNANLSVKELATIRNNLLFCHNLREELRLWDSNCCFKELVRILRSEKKKFLTDDDIYNMFYPLVYPELELETCVRKEIAKMPQYLADFLNHPIEKEVSPSQAREMYNDRVRKVCIKDIRDVGFTLALTEDDLRDPVDLRERCANAFICLRLANKLYSFPVTMSDLDWSRADTIYEELVDACWILGISQDDVDRMLNELKPQLTAIPEYDVTVVIEEEG